MHGKKAHQTQHSSCGKWPLCGPHGNIEAYLNTNVMHIDHKLREIIVFFPMCMNLTVVSLYHSSHICATKLSFSSVFCGL